jgi:hypothetical protein
MINVNPAEPTPPATPRRRIPIILTLDELKQKWQQAKPSFLAVEAMGEFWNWCNRQPQNVWLN